MHDNFTHDMQIEKEDFLNSDEDNLDHLDSDDDNDDEEDY